MITKYIKGIILLFLLWLTYLYVIEILGIPQYAWVKEPTDKKMYLTLNLDQNLIIVEENTKQNKINYYEIDLKNEKMKKTTPEKKDLKIAKIETLNQLYKNQIPYVSCKKTIKKPIMEGYRNIDIGLIQIAICDNKYFYIGLNISGNHEGSDYKFVYEIKNGQLNYIEAFERDVFYD